LQLAGALADAAQAVLLHKVDKADPEVVVVAVVQAPAHNQED
jgi:hypothetical protein